jgi:Alpha 1,4-glycosyltransferase conserved region/Glycosyltransferase sugar-binding region containing DXD motif
LDDVADQALSVSTFWHGSELSSLEVACLLSFVNRGYSVTVFGYETVGRLPSSINFVNAREILDPSWLDKFKIRGKPSMHHFSDLFRYMMIKKTGSIWIDADLVCLAKFFPSNTGDLFTLESEGMINGAVLGMNSTKPELDELIKRTEALGTGTDFAWGSTGPGLLAEVLGKGAILSAQRPPIFYPIGYEEWWKPFLPSDLGFCEQQSVQSATIHLWNNKIEKSGYWKDLAPPANSFLNEVFRKADLLSVFKETCPESVMKQIAENYQSSKFDIRYLRLLPLTKIMGGRWLSTLKKRVT